MSANDMDDLITIVNKLQDAFTSVGLQNPIDLPQIVVVGSQSSGKSSVLENIVGRDFLPRGGGIVTRRPLILQLINTPAGVKNTSQETKDGARRDSNADAQEYGMFVHQPGVKYTDFNKIREEIINDTDLKAGGKGSCGISPNPINLRVLSPNVLTLTLVDLPGITKVPVGNQPKDIERQIRDMILKYINKNNAIILAVTAANTDAANSDALKMAREVDPEGLRTIGVLTKIDLMDPGTDVVDTLKGKIIPLKLGYVPVINRGQKDIERSKSIKLALNDEAAFFENHPAYSDKAAFCGTKFLAKKLSSVLRKHITACMPEIKSRISTTLSKYRHELQSLGSDTSSSSSGIILQVVTEFCNDFRAMLDGGGVDSNTNELNGGARISYIFFESFSSAVNGMDPLEQIRDSDIRTFLYNSAGSSPPLFVAESTFRVLVQQQIRKFEVPCNKLIEMVYDELIRMLGQLLQRPILTRFPTLKDRLHAAVVNFFKSRLEHATKLVSDIISAEAGYVNTAHPDFIKGHGAMSLATQKLSTSQMSPPTRDPKYAHDPRKPAGPGQDSSGSGGIFSTFFTKQTVVKPGVLEAPPSTLKATGNFSEQESIEIEAIRLLLMSYYSIVKKTVTDLIPKSIMLMLVNYAKTEIQKELLAELYKDELYTELLKESEFTVERRKEVLKMITALKSAEEIVSKI